MTLSIRADLSHRALLLAGIAIAIIVAILGGRIWRSYTAVLETTEARQRHIVQLLETSASATFQSVEILLDRAVSEVQAFPAHRGSKATLAERFTSIAQPWPFVYGLSFMGPDGVITDMSRREADGVHRARAVLIDRSSDRFFTVHRDRSPGEDKVFISKPFTGSISNQWLLGMTKAVRGPDGALLGVVIVTLTLDTFPKIFSTVVPEPYVGVGLFRSDGEVLFSMPENNQIGRSYSNTSLFARIRAGQPDGFYRVDTGSPPEDRVIAYRSSTQYPIVIAFGLKTKSILEGWRRASFALGAAAGLGVLMITALTWWLLRQIREEQKTRFGLEQSERRLVESQRLAGIGHFERGSGETETHWADNMYALHGVTREQYPNGRDALMAVVHPDETPDVLAQMRRGDWAENLKPGMKERRIIRPDGEVRIMLYKWHVIDEPPPNGKRLFGVAQDVTAMRQTEAALRENEQRLRDLLECSSDFIWENDANGVMTLFAGRDGESFMPNLGRHGADAEFPEGAPEGQHDLEAFRRAIERREKFRSLVVPLRGQNGDVRWIRTSGNPLFSADGRFLGYRGAGADITEFRRQRQIDEDRRKAEALGRLASGIAHEINNLLQPIIIYATFGSGDGSAGVGQRRYFARITRAAEAASQIVRNVLSFARQRPPSCEDVPVAEVVRETIDLLGEAQPSGIVPVVRPISGTCIVRADRSGFAQMLTNLVTNAAEAMPHGGTITISAAEADVGPEEANLLGVRAGAYCVLTVADTGPGIPSDQIDKVFDPFFTTKPQGKGTGLGLSVVAGHAKSWGGTATVASTIGAGTTFAIYIPMAERQMLAAQ